MKKILLASAAMTVLASPAFAGDLSAPPPAYSSGGIVASPPSAPPPVVTAAPVRVQAIDWTGAYFGGILGYATGDVKGDGNNFNIFSQSLTPSVDGFMGGVATGFNWQYNQIVFGVVGDIVGGSVSGDRSAATVVAPATGNTLFGIGAGGNAFTAPTSLNGKIDSTMNYLATARGKIGYAWYDSPFMLYGTGGLAFGNLKENLTLSGNDGNVSNGASFSQTQTLVGYAVGAGFETMLDKNFSASLEYLYVSLEKTGYFASSFGGTAPVNAGLQTHNFRFGLNYHF